MDSVTLLPLTPDAADAVATVHRAARSAYYGVSLSDTDPTPRPHASDYTAMWRSRLGRPDWRVIGAFSTAGLLGFIASHPTDAAGDDNENPAPNVTGHRVTHLAALYVHPGHWNRGIGARLYDAFHEQWRSSDAATAELEVWSLNHRARDFYVRRGWLTNGRDRPAHEGTSYLGMVLR